MKRAAAVAVLCMPLLVAGCGSSSKPAPVQTVTVPAATQAAAALPSQDMLDEAHALAVKLGCTDTNATPYVATPGLTTIPAHVDGCEGGVIVLKDQADRDAYLTYYRQNLSPTGLQGDRWVLIVQDPNGVAADQAKVGGTEL